MKTTMNKNTCYIFGRWLGDGSKTTNALEIARSNNNYEKKNMEQIAVMLNTTYKHCNNYSTRFHRQQKLVNQFKILYNVISEIHNFSFLKFSINRYSIIAGFLDSDGSVDIHTPNETGISSKKINIVFYNNNSQILYFIQRLLQIDNITSTYSKSYNLKTNVGTDKCNRLYIHGSLDNYFIAYKILPHMLCNFKKKRLQQWTRDYDRFYQKKKINITEIFHSIEGEGRRIGEPITFIRVYGCPHKCSFCDTKYSVCKSRSTRSKHSRDLKIVINDIIKLGNVQNIEFTGGSPDWFPAKIGYLLIYFKARYNSNITMQVSGGIKTDKSNRLFKLSTLNAFDYKDPRENIPFVIEPELIRSQDEIKFLIKDNFSYNFVKKKIQELQAIGINCKMIITTVTNNGNDIVTDHLEKLKKLTEKILTDANFPKENVKIAPREHVLLWGNKKGV
jgi:7-carboxy-7-deazaguanine synthase